MPPYLPREQTERDPPPERPPGDPERGKHPGPERKRTPPAPPPGDRETETGPAALPAVVIAVTHARRPAAPRFGIGEPPPKRASPLAPPTIRLFHFQFNFRIAFYFCCRFTWRTAIAFTHSIRGMMRLVKRWRLRRSVRRETKKIFAWGIDKGAFGYYHIALIKGTRDVLMGIFLSSGYSSGRSEASGVRGCIRKIKNLRGRLRDDRVVSRNPRDLKCWVRIEPPFICRGSTGVSAAPR